jgi:hypothetical protein
LRKKDKIDEHSPHHVQQDLLMAAYRLEPESDDALLVWNAFNKYIARQWGWGVETCPA